MRRPACWTSLALPGSCAENRDTAWIVPVTRTLLTSDATFETSENEPKAARDRMLGSRNWITSPANMK